MVIVIKVFKQMFLHTCFIMHIFPAIRLVIIPPRWKIIDCLTHVLFVTLITGKEIDYAFANTTKIMICSIGFSCNSTSEVFFSLTFAQNRQHVLLHFIKPTDYFKDYCLALTKHVPSFLELL